MMRKMLIGTCFAMAGLLTLATSAPARAIAIAVPQPGPAQLAQAELVVLGKVVALEDQDVQAAVAPGAQKVPYRVALVRVREAIKGKTDTSKLLRVGFMAPQQDQPIPPGGGVRPIRPFPGRFGGVQLQAGQDGMFFLNKHHEGKFHTLPGFGSFVSSEQKEFFENQVKTTRLTLKIADNPQAALKAKDEDERLTAAGILITQYRTFQGSPKTEPAAAEESKLILQTLLDASWDFNRPRAQGQFHPRNLFDQLGVQQNGFQPPRVQPPVPPGFDYNKEYEKSAKEWLKKNLDSYRIQKFVKGPGGVGPIGPGGGPIQILPVPPDRPQIQPLPVERPIQIQPVPADRPIRIQPALPPVQGQPAQPGQVQGGIQIQIVPAQVDPVPPVPAPAVPRND